MIDSDEALDNALRELGRCDPPLAGIHASVGRPRLRKRPAGFPGLVAIILGQQVSTASAAAIARRVEERFGTVTPAQVVAASDEDLQACGLSRPKIRAVRAAALAVESRSCALDDLGGLPVDEAMAQLTAIPGVGPWTAEIYLLFCLGHPDAFPAGDLALQEAVRLGYGLAARPDARALEAFAERWRPLRGAAATLLWGYYALRKGRVAAPPSLVSGPAGGSSG
jgi:DNA-3-methyladenine glycosylase II